MRCFGDPGLGVGGCGIHRLPPNSPGAPEQSAPVPAVVGDDHCPNEQVLTGFRQRHGSDHCILAFDGTCGQSAALQALQTVFRRTEKV